MKRIYNISLSSPELQLHATACDATQSFYIVSYLQRRQLIFYSSERLSFQQATAHIMSVKEFTFKFENFASMEDDNICVDFYVLVLRNTLA